MTAGARQVECTINGVGERAGNASLEEIVMVTRVRADSLPYDTAVNTREIFPTSQLLSALTGENVQANKAIVGRNAFAHEAGIHQDGMLKDRRTYEIMRPEEVGVPQATLVLGKHSGRHAVQRRCEQLASRSTASSSIRSTAPSSRTPTVKRPSAIAISPLSSRASAARCAAARVGLNRPRFLDHARRERLRARGLVIAARCWLLAVADSPSVAASGFAICNSQPLAARAASNEPPTASRKNRGTITRL